MPSLGSRIKTLRKKRKLTLEVLAGQQMTKGMLSLIENDKAKPSMESLSYIAEKLGVGVNELVETISTNELRETLQKVEKLFKEKKYSEVTEQIKPFIKEKLPQIYESAKLLEFYGKASYYLKEDEWFEYLQRADEIYMSLNFYNQSADTNLFILWTKQNEHEYNHALKLLQEKRDIFDKYNAELDIIHYLDYMFVETGLLFAIGKYDEASKRMQEAISYSKEKRVFYRIEELYRVAWLYAMINRKEEDMDYYLKKMTLFVEFTDSEDSRLNLKAVRIHYYSAYLKQYDKALELVEEFANMDELKYFYVMEKGKALFGKGEYQQALDLLLQFEEQDQWNHPFDLSLMYEVYAYIARCYLELGDLEKAFANAKYAFDHIVKFPDTPFNRFILDTMELVRKRKVNK